MNLHLDDLDYSSMTIEDLKVQLDIFVSFDLIGKFNNNITVTGDIVTNHFVDNFKQAKIVRPNKASKMDQVYIGLGVLLLVIILGIVYFRRNK